MKTIPKKNNEKFNVEYFEFYYTGGGVWCAEGQLKDKTYFWGGDCCEIAFDILSRLPYSEDGDAEYYDENSDYFIRHLAPEEAEDFWIFILDNAGEEAMKNEVLEQKKIRNIASEIYKEATKKVVTTDKPEFDSESVEYYWSELEDTYGPIDECARYEILRKIEMMPGVEGIDEYEDDSRYPDFELWIYK